MSVYGAQFLLDALYRGREANTALRLMTSRDTFSWLHMIDDLDATIAMEAWDPSIKPNTTFSHAWATGPANVVARQILGVQVTSPGAAELLIRPQPGPLTWMSGTVPTIRGPVQVSVDKRRGRRPRQIGQSMPRVVVDLPPNTTGRIELDTGALGVAPGSLRIETGRVSSKPAIPMP